MEHQMATAALTGSADLFPAGTTVGAYEAAAGELPPVGEAPTVKPVETATMGDDGELKFTDLEWHRNYYAYAEVDGEHRYTQFSTWGIPGDPDLQPAPKEQRGAGEQGRGAREGGQQQAGRQQHGARTTKEQREK
jgi:hypothetical protein